jgi:hypothetical protein
MNLSSEIFNRLITPGPRLPWLSEWLLKDVWSKEASSKKSPSDYLKDGEAKVNELEQIISSASSGIYDEIVSESRKNKLDDFLNSPDKAVVIFDGLSLREIPILLSLSEKSKIKAVEISTAISAIPSETIDFVELALNIGKISPSQLPSRKELKDRNIRAYYYDSPAQKYKIEEEQKALLLWSSFPDQTYNDSGARFIQHFENNRTLLEEAWKNTVQQIPASRKILITSDHGYIFFGAGCAFTRSQEDVRPLNQFFGGERFAVLKGNETPLQHPDVYYLPERRTCLIKGRVQTHPPGQSGAKLYKHGGLSLMECIVPWIMLEK